MSTMCYVKVADAITCVPLNSGNCLLDNCLGSQLCTVQLLLQLLLQLLVQLLVRVLIDKGQMLCTHCSLPPQAPRSLHPLLGVCCPHLLLVYGDLMPDATGIDSLILAGVDLVEAACPA